MKGGSRKEQQSVCFIYRDLRLREDRKGRKEQGARGRGGGREMRKKN